MKSFNEHMEEQLNEGFFDKIFDFLKNIAGLFQRPEAVDKSVDNIVNQEGDTGMKNLDPKSIKVESTFFINLGFRKDGDSKSFSISLTKLADLPGGAGLFQITGTTNMDMLKALTGTTALEDLQKNNIMAIINNQSIVKDKKAIMKIVKNILPDGKDYTTETFVRGIIAGEKVEQELKNIK